MYCISSYGLFLLLDRKDVDEGPLCELAGEGEHLLRLEGDDSLDERNERIVPGSFHVFSRVKLRPALADEDIADFRYFPAEQLHAEALCPGITTKTGRTACFSVCHRGILFSSE